MRLRIARGALESMVGHARDARPAECCGLLVGLGDAVQEAIRTGNIAADPNRFEIDPKDHIVARREARRRGLAVLGFYHSHPHSRAVPSETDRREATYTGHVYVIVGFPGDQAGDIETRAFRLENGEFVEMDLAAVEQWW
jgi:proteasome lid subunit RPN8/RPN11